METRPSAGRGQRREGALHQDGRTVLMLELLLGKYSPTEIAEGLGCSASAVRQVRARYRR